MELNENMKNKHHSSIQELFRHIQAYSGPCVYLPYSELWDIHNPGILETWGIFRTLSNIYDEAFYKNS